MRLKSCSAQSTMASMDSHDKTRCGDGGRRGAFTLVELLVVIAVISSLVAALVPAVGKARACARRGACRSQLHDIGMGLRMYVDDNRNRMPIAAQLPSEEPNVPTITDVLLPYVKEREVMHCPADRQDSYFEKEDSSYEYPHYLRGVPVDRSFLGKRWGETNTPVLWDFRPFHGREGRPGAMNFLFGDGHVGNLE